MDEKKMQQIQKWFSDEELSELKSLSGEKETVKVENIYPNLYSQMSYAMGDIAKLKEEIYGEIEGMCKESGDFAADALIKSIYSEFLEIFEPYEDSSDFNFTRDALKDFAGDTYTKIRAAESIREINNKISRIRSIKLKIDLAKKGVLI